MSVNPRINIKGVEPRKLKVSDYDRLKRSRELEKEIIKRRKEQMGKN